jgi:hypothetical protein
MVLGNLAGVHVGLGQLDRAEREARDAVALCNEIGSSGIRWTAELTLAEVYLLQHRLKDAITWIRTGAATLRQTGVPLTALPMLYGIAKAQTGDPETGIRWMGFSLANDVSRREMEIFIQRYSPEVRGSLTDEELEARLREGESLNLEVILDQAERDFAAF